MALAGVGRGGQQGDGCFQPEASIAQEASGSSGAKSALDDASSCIVMAPSLGENCRKRGVSLFGHDAYPR